MASAQLYVKTPKGIEELNNRTHGLSPKARQLLVLLDGKRSSNDIAQMMLAEEGAALLTNLIEGGFVVPLLPESEKEAAPSKPAAAVARPANDAERFNMAKNFMRNTVLTFLGGMGSGVISQVEKCNDFDQLRGLYGTWKEAMELSGDGRKQLADLESRLAALLS